LQLAQALPLHRAFCNYAHHALKPKACQNPGEFNKNGQVEVAIQGRFFRDSLSSLQSEMPAKLSHPLSYSGLGLVHFSQLIRLFRPVFEKDSNRTLASRHTCELHYA
jgi:hypothetical protein